MIPRRTTLGLIFALAAFAAAPAGAERKAIDHAAINAAVVEHHVLPRHHAFTEKTAALSSAADKLCPAAEPAALTAARNAFHDALDVWQDVEHLRQGPPAADDAHIRVKFWPDRKSLVDKHLARLMAGKDANILKPEAFAHVSVAVQGFPALERLLFTDRAVEELKRHDRAVTPCAVVGAIARNLHTIAADLEARWRKAPSAGRPPKRVTTDLFNDLATGLGAVADLKLGASLGSGGKARPRRAENRLSGRALRNISRNLAALEDLYDRLARPPAAGLAGTPQDALIRSQFTRTIRAAGTLGPSTVAVLETEEGRLRLQVLKSDILSLRELVVVNLSAALDLVLGFNALDGD